MYLRKTRSEPAIQDVKACLQKRGASLTLNGPPGSSNLQVLLATWRPSGVAKLSVVFSVALQTKRTALVVLLGGGGAACTPYCTYNTCAIVDAEDFCCFYVWPIFFGLCFCSCRTNPALQIVKLIGLDSTNTTLLRSLFTCHHRTETDCKKTLPRPGGGTQHTEVWGGQGDEADESSPSKHHSHHHRIIIHSKHAMISRLSLQQPFCPCQTISVSIDCLSCETKPRATKHICIAIAYYFYAATGSIHHQISTPTTSHSNCREVVGTLASGKWKGGPVEDPNFTN